MFYKIHSLLYRKNVLNSSMLFEEMRCLIDCLPDWKEKADSWVIAHPTKKIIAFAGGVVSNEALEYVQGLIDNNKSVYIVLADENEDDSIITILYKNTPAISDTRYLLSITMKSLSEKKFINNFIGVFTGILKYDFWEFKYILLDTEQYRFNQGEVFNDRLPVGWMLYLPAQIKIEDVPSAYRVIHNADYEGTIIISKEDFNGKDPFDIACANNIEIELASNGLLPLIKGL